MERSGIPRKGGSRELALELKVSGQGWKLRMLNKKTAPTMTRHNPHDTLTNEAINLLLEKGLAEGLPKIAEMLLNAAMIIERSAHLGAGPYERTEQRSGYANGLKERIFHSSLGQLNLRLPRPATANNPTAPRCWSGAHGWTARLKRPSRRCISRAFPLAESPG